MDKLRFTCPCHFGLESVLAFEIRQIGGEDVTVSDGRVSFSGDYYTLARANIRISTAERVQILLGEFTATTFEELFSGVKALPLENFIGRNDAFPVTGHSLNSALHSVPACQSIIKKAAVERLRTKYGISHFPESGGIFRIQFGIIKDKVTICIDTSGEGLHKRGYRRDSNAAPIKETLAAGILDLARVKKDSFVCDPFCGSGTFLIESAFRGLNMAPGLNRRFAAEKWGCIPPEVWTYVRNEYIAKVDKGSTFKAIGYDIDDEAIYLTRNNAKKAGVSSRITADKADIAKFRQPDGSIVVCNPPYGERLLEIKEAEEIYKKMGQVFEGSREKPCYIISPHEEFEKFFGRKAAKRRKLYNGMIKCQLFMYF